MEQEEAKRRSTRPSPAPHVADDPSEGLTSTREGVAATATAPRDV